MSSTQVNKGDSVTFTVNAVDNVKVESLGLTVDNIPVILDAKGQATVKLNSSGDVKVVATAKDAAGHIETTSQTVEVIDPSDVTFPIVSIDLEDDVEISAPIKIKGTISDSNLDYYIVEVAPVGGGEFKEIYRNDNPVNINNDVIATFDPTVLANDAYILRVKAVDDNNHASITERVVNVAGDLKLGNFRLSFTDLSVPVSGIPITVTRSYDSLNANSTDDFGYGWRLEFRDTDLRTSLKSDPQYEELGINSVPFKDGTKVFITLPGGKRETFTFNPTPDRLNSYLAAAGPGGAMYHPAFKSQDGSTSTLTVKDTRLTRNGNEYYGLNGEPFNPVNPAFGAVYILTTKEGIVYEIDANSGDLLTATDTNGNKLTFSDAGIKSSSGKEVTFGRDASGRIVNVVDPAGEKIEYEYDAKGDLVAVTDREDNTTRFKYEDEDRKHFLMEVIDPLGRSGVRTEYDDSGRLKQMIDANGEAVELVYDPDNSTQTVLDVFNKPTTYVYDERGNIVQKVNALGGITKRSFDEDNNLLSETDPEGNTTKYDYDSSGNLIAITDPLGKVARYTYNSFGQVLTKTDPLGDTITYVYDKRRNLLSTTNAQGKVIKEATDSFGNVTSLTDADGNTTRFEYDSFGNVTRQIDALGNETIYTYDASGNQLTETAIVTTPQGKKTVFTEWTYDSKGNVLTKTDSFGNVIRHEYDKLGNLTALIEEGIKSRRTEYRYDEKSRLEETLYPDGTFERFVYDEGGRKVATLDRKGQTTNFVYDDLGRLIETIYPDDTPSDLADNPRTKTEYNKAGRVQAHIDEWGYRTEYDYDKAGNMTLIRDALKHETQYTYDAVGNRLSETNAGNHTTKFVYDRVGRPIETQYADGTRTITTYDVIGRKSSFTDQAGRTIYFIYDKLDRLSEVIQPDDTPNDLTDNPRTKTEYNELGWVTAEIDELGNRQEYEYDLLGRVIESRSSCGCRRKTYTYDEFGNRISETDQLGHNTRFVYDELGRVVETHFPDGTKTTSTYDELDRVIATTDQAGKKTEFEYDPQGQLVAVVDALKHRTEYGYDLRGNLISIFDANGDVTTYEYDELGRRVATVLPNLQRSQTTYDASGNVVSIKDFDKETVTYEYDALNRLTAERFPDGRSLEYTYTPTGLRHTVTEREAGIARTTTYKYDERDRLLWRTEPDGRKIEYTYDAAGNIASVTTPSGTTAYTYDKYNQVTTVTDPDLGVTQYSYNKAGNLTRTEFPNGTIEIREYDNLNRLLFLKNFKVDPGTGQEVTISSYRYTLNAAGQRTKVEENNGRVVEYTYDDLYRLLKEEITDPVAGDRTIGYTYDNVGNRLTCNDSAEGLTTYTYDDNGRLLNETLNGEVTTYSYDDNGNLLSRFKNDTDKASYTWDEENRLMAAVVTDGLGTHNIEYRYDADGVRVASIVDGVETRYLIDANRPLAQVLEEYTSDGTVRASYTYGLDLVSQERGSDRSFYYVDGLGSTRGLTNASGNVSDTYNYDAYGNLIGAAGSTVNNYLYAGEQYDPNLDDYYLRARYYDSETGRFSARDAFEGMLMEPLSLAKYPYVHGNPVNAIDPTGLLADYRMTAIIMATLATINPPFPSIVIGTGESEGLVPGYLKNHGTGADVMAKFPVVSVLHGKEIQVIKKKIKHCNLFEGECDFEGFPVIFWGAQDMTDIHSHTSEAFSSGSPPFLAHIYPGWPRQHPNQNTRKVYPNGRSFSANWYDFTPECPWDNNAPVQSLAYKGFRDCDEYPYASTLQGGYFNYIHNKVSLKLVDRFQNQAQGFMLQDFYMFAGLTPNHPIDSWFGVGLSNSTSYWEDRRGQAYYMNSHQIIPF